MRTHWTSPRTIVRSIRTFALALALGSFAVGTAGIGSAVAQDAAKPKEKPKHAMHHAKKAMKEEKKEMKMDKKEDKKEMKHHKKMMKKEGTMMKKEEKKEMMKK